MADAFGRALLDRRRRSLDAEPRFRRDDGETSPLDVERYFQPPEAWASLERWQLDRLPGRTVLDVGCGAGRAALALRERGRRVVAVDRSPAAVRAAAERGVERTAVADLRALPVDAGAIDATLVLGQQIAAVESPDAFRDALRALARVTAPGGALVADFSDPLRSPDEHADYLADRRLAEGVAYRRFRIEYDGLVGAWITLLMLSPDALRDVTADTPWRVADLRRDGSTYAARLDRT